MHNMKKIYVAISFFISIAGCSTQTNNEEDIYGTYEMEKLLTGCTGYERMELEAGRITIWNYDKCGTGNMHLSSILFGKWKINESRIENSMDSVYEYNLNEKLARIIHIAQPEYIYRFEYIDSTRVGDLGHYTSYDRSLLMIRDTAQSIAIITKINSPFSEWAEYKKIK